MRKNNKGQTTVEWLMLMAVAFITTYVAITGPLATFTTGMVNNIREVTANIVRNGELTNQGFEQGSTGHPSDRVRLRALHL